MSRHAPRARMAIRGGWDGHPATTPDGTLNVATRERPLDLDAQPIEQLDRRTFTLEPHERSRTSREVPGSGARSRFNTGREGGRLTTTPPNS